MDSCGAIAFGEIGEAQNGLRLLGEYTSSRDKAHMCYAFEFLSQELPTATRCAKILQRFNGLRLTAGLLVNFESRCGQAYQSLGTDTGSRKGILYADDVFAGDCVFVSG